METVHKFTLPPSQKSLVDLPIGSRMLKAGEEAGQITVWYQCEHKANRSCETLEVLPTGGNVPKDADYIDSVQMFNGQVWHIYKHR